MIACSSWSTVSSVLIGIPRLLEELAASVRVGNLQAHLLDERVDLVDVLGTSFFVCAVLEPPLDVLVSPVRAARTEHVQALGVPAVDRCLNAAPLVLGAVSQLGGELAAVLDMAQLLTEDARADGVEWCIAAAFELLHLVAADA